MIQCKGWVIFLDWDWIDFHSNFFLFSLLFWIGKWFINLNLMRFFACLIFCMWMSRIEKLFDLYLPIQVNHVNGYDGYYFSHSWICWKGLIYCTRIQFLCACTDWSSHADCSNRAFRHGLSLVCVCISLCVCVCVCNAKTYNASI